MVGVRNLGEVRVELLDKVVSLGTFLQYRLNVDGRAVSRLVREPINSAAVFSLKAWKLSDPSSTLAVSWLR